MLTKRSLLLFFSVMAVFLLQVAAPAISKEALLQSRDPWVVVQRSKPADCIPSWKPLIGEYQCGSEVLSIAESGGTMTLLVGDRSFALREKGPETFRIIGGKELAADEIHFGKAKNGLSPLCTIGILLYSRMEAALRIKPERPVEALRKEAMAAQPPEEHGDFYDTDLVEVVTLDPSIRLDIRYATDNNFMGAPFYSQPRAFLQRPAAEAVARIQKRLKAHGLGLIIYDAYRPWYVTRMFWDATPPAQRNFVGDPAKGSRHNRGTAVDLTVCDLKTGAIVDMGGDFDEFSSRSFIDYRGGTSLQRWHRKLLEAYMEKEDFTVFHDEWWHFDYKERDRYAIGNIPFEGLKK